MDGVPYPAALRAAAGVSSKQEPKQASSEPVSEPVSDETPTNGGKE